MLVNLSKVQNIDWNLFIIIKLELLVIVNHHVTVNWLFNFAHTARHIKKFDFI